MLLATEKLVTLELVLCCRYFVTIAPTSGFKAMGKKVSLKTQGKRYFGLAAWTICKTFA